MATTPPTLTPVVGVPANIPASKLGTLTGIASYDGPYIGGATGLGLGQTPFKYDTTFGGWVTPDSAAGAPVQFTLPVARGDVAGSVAPTGWLIIDLTWQNLDGKSQNDRITLRPQAGSGQVLDLSVSQAPLGYTTPQSLTDLVASINSSKTNADAAAGRADAATGTVAASVAAIPGQVATGLAAVPPALAAMAQSQANTANAAALAATAAGIVSKTNLAAITGADGYYRAMDTGYIYQRTSGANTRRSDLEAASTGTVETARLSALAGAGKLPVFQSTSAAFARNPTPAELLAYGDILGTRLAGLQSVIWNRTSGAWNDYGPPLADAPSVAAVTTTANATQQAVNATKTGLALLGSSAGVQVVDGSTWEPFGTAPAVVDPGQHVQGTGGAWWYRKTEGRAASRAWYPKPNPQDDTSALVGALSVRQTGETLQLPPGDTYLKGSLDMSTFRGGLAGADASSRILCSGLPAFQPYITTRAVPFRKNKTLRSLRIEGPGGMTYGNPGTNQSTGIRVTDSDSFEDVYVTGFAYGWDVNCAYGHISWLNCTTIGNYYGIHNTFDNYDNLHVGGMIHGQYFANMTCAWNTTISGMMIRVHLGGAPATFYQFAAPAGTATGPGVTGLFLVDLVLKTCRFEGSGRVAAYSENPFAHSANLDWEDLGYAQTSDAGMLSVGFSRDTGVPLQLGYLTGDNRMDMRGAAFGQAAGSRTGGIRGAISVESLYGPLSVRFSGNTPLAQQQIRVAGGAVDLLEIQGHLQNNTYGRLQVPAGSAAETINTGLYVPAAAASPVLNSQQPLTNLRSECANDADGQLQIIVQHDAAPAFSIIRWRLH